MPCSHRGNSREGAGCSNRKHSHDSMISACLLIFWHILAMIICGSILSMLLTFQSCLQAKLSKWNSSPAFADHAAEGGICTGGLWCYCWAHSPKPQDWSLLDMQFHTWHFMTWFLHVITCVVESDYLAPLRPQEFRLFFFESTVPFLKFVGSIQYSMTALQVWQIIANYCRVR